MTRKTHSKAAKPQISAKAAASKTPQAAVKPAAKPRSENQKKLLDDIRWLTVLLLALFLMFSLGSFRMDDPAWSRGISAGSQVFNFGGLFGAYWADVAYYLFGFSAWWLLIGAAVWLYRTFRPLRSENNEYQLDLAGFGLGILLLSSPILEALLLGKGWRDSLPAGAGGWLGSSAAGKLSHWFGVSGSSLLTALIVAVGFLLLTQIAWLDVIESIGLRLERLWRRLFERTRRGIDDFAEAKQTRRVVEEAQSIVAAPVVQPKGSSSNRKMSLNVNTPAVPAKAADSGSLKAAVKRENNGSYVLPDLDLLRTPDGETVSVDPAKLQETAALIETKLAEFGISVEVVSATAGPVITRYEIKPAQGVKGSQIVGLSKDLARELCMQAVRVVETVPGKNTMGIELPNEVRQEVLLQEIFAADVFASAKSKLTVALGKDIAGVPTVGDLAKMPHLLVGGMTGSGKSVGVNAMILSMLYKATPDEVRFIMIDPKMLELSIYEGIPHLLCPVVTDMREAGNALNWCVAEMEKRYRLLSHTGVRTLDGFNEKVRESAAAGKPLPNPFSLNPDDPEPLEVLPQIVLVVDELADLMMTERKAVEQQIARIAQKARAAGIHMIIATQRPSVDVVTGLIKANLPTRMAFTVQSKIDSRTILDQMGADELLKYGDLLFLQPGNADPTRLQGAFVSDDEVHRVVDFIKEQGEPNYIDGILSGEAVLETNKLVNPNEAGGGTNDELFDQAVEFVLESKKTSISSLQRHLRIGYNRAANLMQELEDGGIVSPPEVNGARKILARKEN